MASHIVHNRWLRVPAWTGGIRVGWGATNGLLWSTGGHAVPKAFRKSILGFVLAWIVFGSLTSITVDQGPNALWQVLLLIVGLMWRPAESQDLNQEGMR